MDHVKAINGELAQKLNIYKDIWRLKAEPRMVEDEERRIAITALSGVMKRALGLGNQVQDFSLWNSEHKKISLSMLLSKGPVVLCWYQGGWNPYCNIQLRYLQERLDDFTAAGVSLLALSPELPDSFLTTKERMQLGFEVLVDFNNQVARQLGITYQATDAFARQQRLLVVNGIETRELPLPATYILDRHGVIRYAFIDPDYRRRAEPDELLERLYELDR